MPKSFIYFVRNYGSRMPLDVDDEEIDENETPQSNVMPTKMTTRSVSQQGKPLDDFRLPWKPSSKTSGIGRGHVKDRRREIKSPSYHHLSLVTRFYLGLRMTRIRSEKHGSRQASSSHPNKTATITSNTTSNNTSCSSEDSLLDSHAKGGKDKTDAQNHAGCSTEDSKAKAQTVKSSVTNLLRSKLVSGGIRKSSSVDPGKGRSISSGVGISSAGRSRSVVIMRRSATPEDFGKTSSSKTVSSTASQATAHTARKSGLNCRTSSPKCQVIAKKVMRKSPVAVLKLDKTKSEQVKHRKADDLVYSIENGRGKIVHRKLDLDRSVRSSSSSANSNHAAITLAKFPFQNRTSIVDLNDDKENHSLLGLKRGFSQTLHFNDNKVSDATKQSRLPVPLSLPSITDISNKRRRMEGQNDSSVICSVAGKPAVNSWEELTSTQSLKTGILNRFTLRPFLSQHFLTRNENINKQNESITLGKENVINVSKQWCIQSEQPRFFLDKTSDEITLSSKDVIRSRSLSDDTHSGTERGLLGAGVRAASRNKDVAELSKPTTGTHRTIVYPPSTSTADKISQMIVGKKLTETLPYGQGSSIINTDGGCHSAVRDDLRSTSNKMTHILQNESRPGGLVLSRQYLESLDKAGSRPLLDNITRQVRVATLGNNTPVFVCTGPIRAQSSQRHYAAELSASSSVSSQSLPNVKIDRRSLNNYPMKSQMVSSGISNIQSSDLANDRVAKAQGIRADSNEMGSKSNVLIPLADALRMSVQSSVGSANLTPDSNEKQARLSTKQDFINCEMQASLQNRRDESEGSHVRSEARPSENLQEMFPKTGHVGNFFQADKMPRHFATAMNSSANIIFGNGLNTLRNSGETKTFVDNIHSGQPQSCPPLALSFPFDIMRATANYVSASSMTTSKITNGSAGFESSKTDMPPLEALMPSSTPMLYSSPSFMTSSGPSNNRIPLTIIGNSASLHEDKSAAKIQLLPIAETGITGSMPSSASEPLIPSPAFYTSSSGHRNIRFPDKCNVFATPASDLLCSVAKSPPESLQTPRRSDMVITDLPQPYPTNMTQLPTSMNLPCSEVLPTSATSVWSDHFVQLSKDMVNAALVCQLSGKDHVYDKPPSKPSKPSSPSLLFAGQDLKDLKMTSSDVTPENIEAKSVAFGDNNKKANKSTSLNKTNDRKRKMSMTPLDVSFDNKDDNSPPATSTPMTTSSSTTTSTLSTNMNFVSGRNPKCDNMCPLCCRIFTRSWLLKGHMRTHTGERPYHCSHPHCDKAFADRSNLRSHMLIHSSHTRSFPCSKCGRTFSQKRYLHKHRIEVCKIREDNK